MLRTIFTAGVAASILALSATAAFAQSELDNEKAFANFSPDTGKGTVVLRVDKSTGAMAILNAGKNIASNQEAQKIAQTGAFVALNQDKVATAQKSELDDTKEQTGWYVIHHGFNYYPTFAWGGVWAQPAYAYANNNYNYFYYNTGNYTAWDTGYNYGLGWNNYVPYVYNYGYGYGYGVVPTYYYNNYAFNYGIGVGWGGAYGGYRSGFAGGYRGTYGAGYGRGGFGGGRRR